MKLSFKANSFEELTVHELHDLLRLRTDIFVVEQKCAYHEIDGRDPASIHILAVNDAGLLVAGARIVPPEEKDALPHVGRVVVRSEFRRKGIARQLMSFTLETLERVYGSKRSDLAAQTHLEEFYASCGYKRNSAEYLWDGIMHVDMVRGD
jgi:ElaA protein